MAGGDTYTIIYLKMQLLSLKTDGVLTWTGLEENFADELALDLDEKPEDVEVTLMYLLKTGLAETKDNVSFFFPFVIENTGSEDASAQRVREYRKRQALLTGLGQTAPKTNAQRQKSFRAKQNCESKQHIPMIENDMNKKRYGGNYYLVCQRDGYKCAICGSIENLCVHHIDGFDERKPENNAENKMILLCRSCHSRVHAGTPIPQENLDRISYENSNVTCNTDVTQVKRDCNVEKEIEIEIEIEREEAPPAPPSPPPQEPPKETAHKYGDYGWVKLTDSQYAKLLKELGHDELERCITHVDESAQSTGNKNKWKDWNLVVRRCHREGWGLHRQQYSNGSGKKKVLTAMDV